MADNNNPDTATQGQDFASIAKILQGLQEGLARVNQTMTDMKVDIIKTIDEKISRVEQRVDALEIEVNP